MRLVAGIWLVQILTIVVVWLGLSNPTSWQMALSLALALAFGALAAIWIKGTLKDQVRLHEARFSERLAAKSEEFSTKLSQQRAREAERLADLAQKSGNSRTGLLRAGILTGGALGLGAALVMAQFVGMALLLAAFSGGGAAGYFLSSKTQRRSLKEIEDSGSKPKGLLSRPGRLRMKTVSK
jgi:hypothetical protein